MQRRILLHLPDDRLLLASKGPPDTPAYQQAAAISSPATGGATARGASAAVCGGRMLSVALLCTLLAGDAGCWSAASRETTLQVSWGVVKF
jgi:hypothetical protein